MPAVSFPFNLFDDYEIQNGKANPGNSIGLGILKSLKIGSFSGIVRETPTKSEIDEIEELYKNSKFLYHYNCDSLVIEYIEEIFLKFL